MSNACFMERRRASRMQSIEALSLPARCRARAVACVMTAATIGALAHGAAAQSVCPEGLLPPDAACGPCDVGWFIRATDLDGTRHLLWAAHPFEKRVVTAKEVAPGDWEMKLVQLEGGVPPVNPTQAAIDGDLHAIAWGGKVDVLRAVDGAWEVEASLTSPLPNFGRCVAISAAPGQPERIAVGTGILPVSPGPDGAVLIFRRDAEWTLEQTLTPPPGVASPQAFGSQVAIDGARVVATCLSADTGPNPETLWVHELVDGTWILDAGIAAPVWLPPLLGERVALRGDQIAARCRAAFSSHPATLSVATFVKGADGWTFVTAILSDSASSQFGGDLASIVDGDDMLLGIANGGMFSQSGPTVVLTAGRFVRLRDGAVIEHVPLHAPGPQGADFTPLGIAIAGPDSPWLALGEDTGAIGGPAFLLSAAVCTPVVAGDLDGDGVVNGADLGILLDLWATDDPLADFDGSGFVDGADLAVLLAGWG